MKIISTDQLCKTDYNLRFLNALQQFWRDEKSFSCFNHPKKTDLLFFLYNCSAEYTDKNGKKISVPHHSVVYTPQGCEYSVTLFDLDGSKHYTIGVNFFLYDEQNLPFVLSDGIKIFDQIPDKISYLFHELNDLDYHPHPFNIRGKILLYEILTALSGEQKSEKHNTLISEAITYLNEHYAESPSITALAKKCNISEVYFRRLFKKQMGMSPSAYRNKLRLTKAKEYLQYGENSVREISEILGYDSVSHFIKAFKSEIGFSPLAYRKKFQ